MNSQTRSLKNPQFVKICGITRVSDAILINSLGADALGFIFYPESKRFIDIDAAAKIGHALSENFIDAEVNIGIAGFADNHRSAKILRAGVFVNPTRDALSEAVEKAGLDIIQLHGNESKEFVASVRKEFPKLKLIKALRLETPEEKIEYEVDFKLLDHAGTEWGGSGKTIDWSKAKSFVAKSSIPVILAGGLHAQNILEAVQSVSPFGIDLSSGVESSPGIKSPEKLRDLFQTLNRGST